MYWEVVASPPGQIHNSLELLLLCGKGLDGEMTESLLSDLDKPHRRPETHNIINRQSNIIINGNLLIATKQGTNPLRSHGENVIRELCFSNGDAFIRDLERSVYNWTVRKITGMMKNYTTTPSSPQMSVNGGGTYGFCADYRHFKWIYKHKLISVAFNIRRYIHLWMMLATAWLFAS